MACDILNLPDLVLHHICKFITCPFDLLHLGSTCTRLRCISFSDSLWRKMAFYWFRGFWRNLNNVSSHSSARQWMLDAMKYFLHFNSGTKKECSFPYGETWERADSRKFRFLVSLSQNLHTKPADLHPLLLYERWLYDIGLYYRKGSCLDYCNHDGNFSNEELSELSKLGQAAERDLRRRKQPNKHFSSYIKLVSASKNYVNDLFPPSLLGSCCPFLLSPYNTSSPNSRLRIERLKFCIGLSLEICLQAKLNVLNIPFNKISKFIENFTGLFMDLLNELYPLTSREHEEQIFLTAISEVISQNLTFFSELQHVINTYDLFLLKIEDVLHEFMNILTKSITMNCVLEEISFRLRKCLIVEIEKILFANDCKSTVVRVNLTDSDMIGDTNSQQEMAAAAFITDKGAFVTWHLVAKMRY